MDDTTTLLLSLDGSDERAMRPSSSLNGSSRAESRGPGHRAALGGTNGDEGTPSSVPGRPSHPSPLSSRSLGCSTPQARPVDDGGRSTPTARSTTSSESGWGGSELSFDSNSAFAGEDRRASSSSRRFAPGLGPRKKKVDPYDPLNLLTPKDEYTMLKKKEDAELRGTWTTIDPDDKKRSFDARWHADRKRVAETHATASSGTPQTPKTRHQEPNDGSSAAKASATVDNGIGVGGGSTSETPGTRKARGEIDERFENPDIDVDAEVRATFLPIGRVLDERMAPHSAFEMRNNTIAPKRVSAPKIKVILDGQVMKTMQPKADNRGEMQDRFGRYVGENLGMMKKHLVEDRAALIKIRDEEMVRATKEKRAWEAIEPDVRADMMAKRRAMKGLSPIGPGADDADMFDYSAIPDVYTKKVTAESLASWSTRDGAQNSAPSTPSTTWHVGSVKASRVVEDDDDSIVPSRASDLESARRQRVAAHATPARSTPNRSRLIAQGIAPEANRPASVSSSMSRGAPSPTASTAPDHLSFSRKPPELVPLEDVVKPETFSQDDELADKYDTMRALCKTRGRVVVVSLHEPVHFSPGAVVSRTFGGVLQEIQFHPQQRTALVVFVFPGEAEAFVKHVRALKETDRPAYGRLQIGAEWYGGRESEATYAVQRWTHISVIQQEARRVLSISGVPEGKKKEEVAEEMKERLGKPLVKTALVRDPRRHVRARDGNTAILEFVSIRDAVEAEAAFRDGKVAGYERNAVRWLQDPCDRAAEKSRWCSCANCRR